MTTVTTRIAEELREASRTELTSVLKQLKLLIKELGFTFTGEFLHELEIQAVKEVDREYRASTAHPERLSDQALADKIGEVLESSPNTGTPLERLVAEAVCRLITPKLPPNARPLSELMEDMEREGYLATAHTLPKE